MIWKRNHNCVMCKQNVYFDDEKDIITCSCGQWTIKMLIKDIKQQMLKTKFTKTHAIKLVMHGFEPVEIQ